MLGLRCRPTAGIGRVSLLFDQNLSDGLSTDEATAYAGITPEEHSIGTAFRFPLDIICDPDHDLPIIVAK